MTQGGGRSSAGLAMAAIFLVLAFLVYYIAVRYPGFDAKIAVSVLNIRTPALTSIMSHVTWLGDWQMKFPVVLLSALVLTWRGYKRQAWAALASALGGEITIGLLKTALHRPRPPAPYPIYFIPSFSFPSDHAFAAISIYGLILYFACRVWRGRAVKTGTASAGLLIALLLGFSRVYLGVHWATDVLGGYAFGAGWAVLIVWAFSPASLLSPCSGCRLPSPRSRR